MKILSNTTDTNLIFNFDNLDKVIRKAREEFDSQLEADVLERFLTEESLVEARFSDFTLYVVTPPTIEQTKEIWTLKEQYMFDWPSNIYLTIEDEIWEGLND